MNEKIKTMKKAFLCAFPYTIPIFAGFWFLGMTYGIYMNVVPAFQLFDDHLTGPGAVKAVVGKCILKILFNRINGDCAGIAVTGAEADCKDGFFCFCIQCFLTSVI